MSLIDKMKSFIGADEEYEDEMGFEKKEKAQASKPRASSKIQHQNHNNIMHRKLQ